MRKTGDRAEGRLDITRRNLAAGAVALGAVGGAAQAQGRSGRSSRILPTGLPDENDISAAYIDKDEWRDKPVRHRYVHGGFRGTKTRFSFYLPPKEQYRGRFIQYLEGGAGGHETLLGADGYGPEMSYAWLFKLCFEELGGYMVESNQGHFPGEGTGFGNSYELWGGSAQSAQFGREVARKMYGETPHHGYVWGGSGGGSRSGRCLEERPDIWHGGAPHCGIGQNTQWSSWALVWLAAREKFPQIIDAMEPGGSGKPFEGLTHMQREALADFYRRGWPRGAENQLAPFYSWAYPMYTTLEKDGQYFKDFWEKPGYLGHDNPDLLKSFLVSERAKVSRAIPVSQIKTVGAQQFMRLATAGAVSTEPTWGIALDAKDPERLFMSNIKVLTGKAAGRELFITSVEGDVISPFMEKTPEAFENVAVGDEVELNNRNLVAFAFYHRYTADLLGGGGDVEPVLQPWQVDGEPVYPSRGVPPVSNSSFTSFRGKFSSKMIYVQPTHDAQVWATTIFPYVRMLQKNMGARLPEHFRFWFVENSPHGAPRFLGPALTPEKDPGVWDARLVPYDGVTAEALRQVVRWVEENVPPTEYRGYGLTRDNALHLPKTVAERGGVQPIVTAKVNGGVRADVKTGQAVTLAGRAEHPPNAGALVAAEWDFEGRGKWEHKAPSVGGLQAEATVTHAYARPGTYFPAFRVSALPPSGKGPPIQNIGRVRVVVT